MPGIALVVLSQLIVPVSSATVNYETSACRAAEDYGSVAFDVTFTCTLNTSGQTGCSYSGILDLDTQLSPSGLYKYLCLENWPNGTPQIEDIQIHLSGVEADTNTYFTHHNFRAGIKLDSFDPTTYEAKWTSTLEWEDRQDIMVDTFDVVIHARLHWSATPDIRFTELSLPCTELTGSGCLTSTLLNVGAGNVIGGVAFSEVGLSADNASAGMEPTELQAKTEESLVSGTTYDVASKCTIGGAAGVTCDNRVIVIHGKAAAFQPFQANFDSTLFNSGTPFSSNAASGFAESTGTIANMNCGLRGFLAGAVPNTAIRYRSLWFGQRSRDCNWSPGNLYTGVTVFGFENNTSSSDFRVVNLADGVRVP